MSGCTNTLTLGAENNVRPQHPSQRGLGLVVERVGRAREVDLDSPADLVQALVLAEPGVLLEGAHQVEVRAGLVEPHRPCVAEHDGVRGIPALAALRRGACDGPVPNAAVGTLDIALSPKLALDGGTHTKHNTDPTHGSS